MLVRLTAGVAICAITAAAPTLAQDPPKSDDTSVYRSDLPETHDGFELPEADAEALAAADADMQSLAAHSASGQQLGNVIASKNASGAARDLGDAMILLHSGILRRITPESQEADVQITERAQDAIAALDALNGKEANLVFARWITKSYPEMIETWEQAGEAEGLGEISGAVVPILQQQHAVAEAIVEAEGDLDVLESTAVEELRLGGAENAGNSQQDGPTGEEGQTGERQHTTDPEQPAVQTGENYAREQVEVDPQSETRAEAGAAGSASAAGEVDIVNAGGLFSAMTNPSVEIEQLESQEIEREDIRVVKVSELLTEAEMTSFRVAFEDADSDLSALQDAAGAHSAVSNAIENAGATTDEVVAIDVLDVGLVVYTHSE